MVGFAFAERAAPQAESKASQGKDALSKKMYPEAIQYFDVALEENPDCIEAMHNACEYFACT